jgi:PAS domain S-box-containing protein/putative nucleotidyltransferase with HDIG domain
MPQHHTILIADDLAEIRSLIGDLLRGPTYRLIFAANGQETLEAALSQLPDLLLLDLMMPGLDGLEICRRLRADMRTAEMPIIMVTAFDDNETRLAGLMAGADDFVSKPFNRAELRARVHTITRLNRYRRLHEEHANFERLFDLSPEGIAVTSSDGTIRLANRRLAHLLGEPAPALLCGQSVMGLIRADYHAHFTDLIEAATHNLAYTEYLEAVMIDRKGCHIPVELNIGPFIWNGESGIQMLVRDISERKQAEAAIHSLNQDLLAAYDATLEGWVKALDLRDKETEGHSLRVTALTVQLAQAMGIEGEELQHVRRGALLHDIGKLGVPDRVLLKAGPLTDEEWAVMRKHPLHAYEWLHPIAYLRPVLAIPLSHHERFDGSGYPHGLAGEAIPLAARIFAVVDVWDAMTSDRHYRSALAHDEVGQYLRMQAGRLFDAQVVEVFLQLMARGELQVAGSAYSEG